MQLLTPSFTALPSSVATSVGMQDIIATVNAGEVVPFDTLHVNRSNSALSSTHAFVIPTEGLYEARLHVLQDISGPVNLVMRRNGIDTSYTAYSARVYLYGYAASVGFRHFFQGDTIDVVSDLVISQFLGGPEIFSAFSIKYVAHDGKSDNHACIVTPMLVLFLQRKA